MTRIRKFGALLLLLASFLSPAMACAVASSPMTAEEQACCQTMKGHCGQEQMPASHGCCHRVPGSIYDHALKVKAGTFHQGPVSVAWIQADRFKLPASFVHGLTMKAGLLSVSNFPPLGFSILRT